MNRKTMSNRYALVNTVFVLALLSGLFSTVAAQAVSWTNETGDNAWNNPKNWDSGELPDDGTNVVINRSGEDRAVVKERPESSDFTPFISGELEIRAPFIQSRGNRPFDLQPGGVINVYSLFHPKQKHGLRFRGGGWVNLHKGTVRLPEINERHIKERCKGQYGFTVHGGTLDVRSNLPLKSKGELHIKGGKVKVAGDVQLSSRSLFRVDGAGSEAINIDGYWRQGDRAMLHVQIGRKGITPIKVGGDVTFADGAYGALLNVDCPEKPVYGEGKVMTWEGDLKKKGLRFADSVDESVWNFEMHKNDDGGGYMTLAHRNVNGLEVTDLHVPEHSTMGEEVGVTANVANETESEHTEKVKLLIDGEVRKSTEMTLAAGASDSVHFTYTISDRNTGKSDVRVATADHYADASLFRMREDGLIDHVDFGNAESEQAASLTAKKAETGKGGLDQPYRRLTKPDGSMKFRLKVQPRGDNYVTLKFWGSEHKGNMPLRMRVGGHRIPRKGEGDSHIPVDAKTFSTDEPAFKGRCYYTTYKLPENAYGPATETIPIKIIGDGGSVSPAIYRAYTHARPCFEPMDDEPRGEKPEPKFKEPRKLTEEERIKRKNRNLNRAFKFQYYGSPWDEWVEEGKMPEYLYGAIGWHGGNSPHPPRSESWIGNEGQWKYQIKRCLGGNLSGLSPLSKMASAYNKEWSDYYKDDEVVDRVAEALDVYCLAQASNGGFGENTDGWLGAPDRKPSNNNLYTGPEHLGRAFLQVHKPMKETGRLKKKIDNDLNPETPDVTRREAYTQLFEGIRSYYVASTGQRGVPNQQMYNLAAAVAANLALYKLGADTAWGIHEEWTGDKLPEGRKVHGSFEGVNSFAKMLEVAAGLRLNAWDTRDFSPAGMPNEAKYAAGYGRGSVRQIRELAELSGYEPIKRVAEKAKEAYFHFRYPSIDDNGYKLLRWEGIISRRSHRNYPGSHAGYVKKGQEIGGPAPMLGDEDVMWTDPYLGLIAMKHNGHRMYLYMNWKGGWRGSGRDHPFKAGKMNAVARIHYTTDEVDRIGTVDMDAPYGHKRLYEMDYGDYLIRMNLSKEHTYPINIPERLHGVEAVDLVSGKRGELREDIKLKPRTTRVFYIGDE